VIVVVAWRFFTTGGVEMLRSMGHGSSHAAPMQGGEMQQHRMATDPVCGMTVDPDKTAHRSIQKGETYYFCAAGCKESFDKNPDKYVSGAKSGSGSA
jgi:YHS domain-containing protein